MKTVFRNGRVLDPQQDLDFVGSVIVEDSQIVDVGPDVDESNPDIVYDCEGLWIAPGLVDLHANLREPGYEHRETIKTGTQAAAAGGFTFVCCMPNTNPALDNAALIDFILDKAASPDAGGVFVAPVGALTVGQAGEQVTDLYALKKAGVVGVSDQGHPIQNSAVMQRAMEFCLQLDLPLLVHCDDRTLSKGGAMNDGEVSAMLGLRGIPRTAEEIMIMRNCALALNTGCRVHIMRVSTWGGVHMIRMFKELGAPITCDISPHHFSLTDQHVGEFDPNFKTTPPLRTQVDLDVLLPAIQDGTIDCISSDHSPYAAFETEVPFDEAPFGMAGFESAVGATLTHLTHKGILSPLETVRRLSSAPSEILRLDAGSLQPGDTSVAQITVIDPALEWTFDRGRTFSRGKNTPYHGAKFTGKSVVTYCGTEIYRDPGFDEKRYIVSMA